MLRFKRLANRGTCIVDNGACFVFDRSGICIKENVPLTPEYTSNTLELPMISMLSSAGYLEFYIFKKDGNVVTKSVEDKDGMHSMLYMQKFMSIGNYISQLQRKGVAGGIRFNQVIYVYKEGTDVDSIIKEVL